MTMIVTALLIAALQATPSVEVQVSESENYLEFYNETIRQGLAQIQDEETLRYIGDAADRYDTDLYFRQRINAFLCGCEAEELVYWLDGEGALYTDAIRNHIYSNQRFEHSLVEGMFFSNAQSLMMHGQLSGFRLRSASENENAYDTEVIIQDQPPEHLQNYSGYCHFSVDTQGRIHLFHWGDPHQREVSIAWARCTGEWFFSLMGYAGAVDMLEADDAISYILQGHTDETILSCKDNVIAYFETDYTLCPMLIRGLTYKEQPPKALVDSFMVSLIDIKYRNNIMCLNGRFENAQILLDPDLYDYP